MKKDLLVNLTDLLKILSSVSDKEFREVTGDQLLVKELDLSSIEIIDFIFELEKHYTVGLKISDFLNDENHEIKDQYRDFTLNLAKKIIEQKSGRLN